MGRGRTVTVEPPVDCEIEPAGSEGLLGDNIRADVEKLVFGGVEIF